MSERLAQDAAKAVAEAAEAQYILDALHAEITSLKNSALTPEQRAVLAAIRGKWAEIEDEFADAVAVAQARVDAAQEAARQAVASCGATVKANGLQAVYTPGRVTWDAKALDDYAAAHPELLAFRRQSKPGVALRWTGEIPDGAGT